MAENMRDSTVMIKNMAMASILGQISENIRVCGSVENSMVSVSTQYLDQKPSTVCGKMESVLSGLITILLLLL
jgi:hypothetical protein